MIVPDLLLDPQLKYWVLLPISIAMVFVGLLRSNITYLIQPNQKLQDYKKVRQAQFLQKVKCFRENQQVLTQEEFNSYKTYLISNLNTDEFFAEKSTETKEENMNPFDGANNDAIMSMAKGNLMNFIPQTLIMGWVNYFFAGFVIMKLPFPLTDGFKSMLQNGIMTPDLNVRYVSSISWYFISLMGLRPVYSLIMGSDEAEELIKQQQQQQSPIPNLGGPGGPKADKVFKAEAENLQILDHESIYDGVVDRFVSSFS
ncbi:uncharacterized protein KGF55_004372 [Candida pseudojiufengensis]|uniref:uncharacterized protein n=1 Tax=Candida pseudojiufengensis TaxID=497109 RepID=UPI00222459E6|nr:uncharacterized protein KGF55_004372 [Candida pseudojiufengensis]KAI5960802.1 hypothetical protein KGF55_004372 [Candida pseudojiufengensis]